MVHEIIASLYIRRIFDLRLVQQQCMIKVVIWLELPLQLLTNCMLNVVIWLVIHVTIGTDIGYIINVVLNPTSMGM